MKTAFMKWFFAFSLFFFSCRNSTSVIKTEKKNDTIVNTNDTVSKKEQPVSDLLIVPGESVGKIHLNEKTGLLEQQLGRPTASDAAMGKAWLTWKGKRDEHSNATELNIYTTYRDNTMQEKTVQQVRTTSSFFSTQNNIHVYSSLGAIQTAFPNLKKRASYNGDGRIITIYDEMQKGIAFEIVSAGAQQLCVGIIIHKKGTDVTQIYIMLHPSMQRY